MGEEKISRSFENFKIIAIRPLKGCDPKYSKGLELNRIYKFYNCYNFLAKGKSHLKDEEVDDVTLVDKDIMLYSEKIHINISAIVGQNGSGKSTILELIYLSVFKVSEKRKLLRISTNKEIENYRKEENSEKYSDLIQELERLKNFKCELYFTDETLDDKVSRYYKLLIDGESINLFQLSDNKWVNETNCNMQNLFYSIAINYSLYGLNDKYDVWLSQLFHKNDGYKTPLVINPYRIDGNIDVNKELHLAQSRTILNVLDSSSFDKEIIKGKEVSKIRFNFSTKKNESIQNQNNGMTPFQYIIDCQKSKTGDDLFDVFEKFASEVLLQSVENDFLEVKKLSRSNYDSLASSLNLIEEYKEVQLELVKYIVKKIYKICLQYPDYRHFINTENSPSGLFWIQNLETLFKKIKLDESHITLKLKQAFYTLKGNYFENFKINRITNLENRVDYFYEVSFDKLKDIIVELNSEMQKTLEEKLELVPGAYFMPEVYIKHKKGDYKFSSLSSGEQQLCNALQTINYHLFNLESVHKIELEKEVGKEKNDGSEKNINRIPFKNINIIFDEIELYFHPEYQRIFIKSLIDSIDKLKLDSNYIKAINIIFSTHSPFILSDIPSSNILRLEDGKPQGEGRQTFASNIYDLLNDDFFLNKGVIGEFAREKIDKILTKQNAIDKDDAKIIDLIGDPFLKGFVIDKVSSKISDEELIRKQIEDLEQKLKKIKNEDN